MSFQEDHRMAVTEEQEILPLEPPFSFFDLVETRFGGYDSIRRIFSLARSFHAETLTIENLPPSGIIAEENEDILARYPDYRNVALLRLSFWEKTICHSDLPDLTSNALAGYAILKHDVIGAIGYDHWHIFGNRSPAPHLCPFRPPQVQGVHLGGRNEQIWGTSEQLQLRVEGSLLPLVNGYE